MTIKLFGQRAIKTVCFDIPSHLISNALIAFNKQLITIPKLKTVTDLKDQAGFKRVTLDHRLFTSPDAFLLNLSNEQKKFIEENHISFKDQEIILTADNLSLSEILDTVLPPNVSKLSGFSTIGHIAQVNINEEHIPYKKLIGEAILLKNPEIKTVVAKLNNLHAENVYRTLDFEVIAGKNKTFTRTVENKFVYFLDLKKVFFNPRLSRERVELISSFSPHEVIGLVSHFHNTSCDD